MKELKTLKQLSLAFLVLASIAISLLLISYVKAADIFANNGVPEISAFKADSANSSTYLSFEQRVSCQKEIERVFYKHRTWNNKAEKPPFEKAVSADILRNKVTEALQKTNALMHYWKKSVIGEALQREMERIARDTKNPEMLKEIWASLKNDPYLIAECVARPIIVDRFLKNYYSDDDELQGGLKNRVHEELKDVKSVESMKLMSGQYKEVIWTKSKNRNGIADKNANVINEAEWNDLQNKINLKSLGIKHMSGIIDEEERIYIMAILEATNDRMKIATVSWAKKSYGEWWQSVKNSFSINIEEPDYAYKLPSIDVMTACLVTDFWSPIPSCATRRGQHTAIWTGTEMIIWGGTTREIYDMYLNSGAKYDPIADYWQCISPVNAPDARYGHTAVWTGSKMIIWGGKINSGTAVNTGGVYNLLTNQWSPTSTIDAPTLRAEHTAVWTGSVMVVWGGHGCPDPPLCRHDDDLYNGGRYDPETDTWQRTTLANVPTRRRGHQAVWAPEIGEMIVWGGFGCPGYFCTPTTKTYINSGGRYNPETNSWTSMTTTNAPEGRELFTAVWTGSKMIVWGGNNTPYPNEKIGLNTGGQYDPVNDNWSPTSTGPSSNYGRYSHTAVWANLSPPAHPLMLIWGGIGPYQHVYENTGWKYDPATDSWENIPHNSNFEMRYLHTAIWTGSQMIIWGGYGCLDSGFDCYFPGYINTGAKFNPDYGWYPYPISNRGQPEARTGHTAVSTGSEMIIWGGLNVLPDNYYFMQGATYDPVFNFWRELPRSDGPGTSIPYERKWHTAIWTGTEMIIWGGYGCKQKDYPFKVCNAYDYLDDFGRYDPIENQWNIRYCGPPDPNIPAARSHHTAVWTGSEMIIWGGCSGPYESSCDPYNSTHDGNFYNTGSRFNPAYSEYDPCHPCGCWYPPITKWNAPQPRYLHSAIWSGSRMIIWGGSDGSNYLNDGGKYRLPALLPEFWEPVSSINAPSARQDHTAIWTGSRMIIWGGYSNIGLTELYFNTGSIYNPFQDIWESETAIKGAPSGRTRHTAIWNGSSNNIVIWGGYDGIQYLNTGGIYYPGSNRWSATSLENAPTGRVGHTAVWTDPPSQMVIWGGPDDTGANYCIP